MRIKLISESLPALLMLTAITTGSTVNAEDYPVAGINPSQRPADAPVIEWVEHNRAWYQQALTGIKPPYPHSLYFLDNQGNWYTPFTRPGMTGPYDLRGWYQ